MSTSSTETPCLVGREGTMSTPDVETLMATRPCKAYPRERVGRILESCGNPQTWEAFAIAVRDRGWVDVAVADLHLTAYRAATRGQRLRGVVNATHQRVEAQMRRHPEASPVVADLRRRLLSWAGDLEEVRSIRTAAAEAATAAYSAATATAYATAYDTAYACAAVAYSAAYADDDDDDDYDEAAAYAAYAAYAAAYADDDDYDDDEAAAAWDGLLCICRVLDSGVDVDDDDEIVRAS